MPLNPSGHGGRDSLAEGLVGTMTVRRSVPCESAPAAASVCLNATLITMPKTAIASSAAMRDTALLMPEATPARPVSNAFITVVVNGATLTTIPNPNTSKPGKKVDQ